MTSKYASISMAALREKANSYFQNNWFQGLRLFVFGLAALYFFLVVMAALIPNIWR